MNRRILIALLLIVFALGTVRVALAQTASKSATPLLIKCDVTTEVIHAHCTNDPNKSCAANIECGDGGQCVGDSSCTISDFFNQFILLAQWGLTLVSVLGLLLMVYGGFQWITAAGRASKIEEGKRVFIGTLVGIAISFSAYLIINLTITSITGTTTKSLNPFAGPVATVFGGEGKDLERPFSGDGTPLDTVTNCHDRWDNSCDNQIYCADISSQSGGVRTAQELLNGKNCKCGKADGCYGSNTAVCVRKFQIANNLPPTGELDERTETLLQGAGAGCDIPAPGEVVARVNSVSPKLPVPSVTNAQAGDRTKHGCCVVQPGSTPLYCLDQVSERTCLSLGTGNKFYQGPNCARSSEASAVCGFCHANERKCFGVATQNWCQTKADAVLTFVAGTGFGNSLCQQGYVDSLRTTKP